MAARRIPDRDTGRFVQYYEAEDSHSARSRGNDADFTIVCRVRCYPGLPRSPGRTAGGLRAADQPPRTGAAAGGRSRSRTARRVVRRRVYRGAHPSALALRRAATIRPRRNDAPLGSGRAEIGVSHRCHDAPDVGSHRTPLARRHHHGAPLTDTHDGAARKKTKIERTVTIGKW